MTRKQEFMKEYSNSLKRFGEISKMVVAIKLPTGATELIINTENIHSKYEYYLSAYDDDMCLSNNKDVEIVGLLCV